MNDIADTIEWESRSAADRPSPENLQSSRCSSPAWLLVSGAPSVLARLLSTRPSSRPSLAVGAQSKGERCCGVWQVTASRGTSAPSGLWIFGLVGRVFLKSSNYCSSPLFIAALANHTVLLVVLSSGHCTVDNSLRTRWTPPSSSLPHSQGSILSFFNPSHPAGGFFFFSLFLYLLKYLHGVLKNPNCQTPL